MKPLRKVLPINMFYYKTAQIPAADRNKLVGV